MTTTQAMHLRRALGLAAAISSGALTVACGGGSGPEALRGVVVDPAPVVSDITLPEAATGEDVVLAAAPGHVLTVYFGYTSCPDVCPTTMSDVRNALTDLGDDAGRIEFAFVTIDPDRDLGDTLRRYVRSFVTQGVALRTTDATVLRAAADAFGADYSVTTAADGTVEVAHTAYLYAVDEAGHVRVSWPFGVRADDISHDLRLLLDEADERT